jgi:hypothetical protein
LLPWSNWSCCVQAVGAAIRSDTAIFAYNQQYWLCRSEVGGERRWRLSLPRLCLYFVSTKLNDIPSQVSRSRDEFDGLDRITRKVDVGCHAQRGVCIPRKIREERDATADEPPRHTQSSDHPRR